MTDLHESLKNIYTADQIEEAILQVIIDHKWPYEHAIALEELKGKLGICLHEDYDLNGGLCSQCGKVFPGEWI